MQWCFCFRAPVTCGCPGEHDCALHESMHAPPSSDISVYFSFFYVFSAMRNFADRADGLTRISSTDGVIGFAVTMRSVLTCPHLHTGSRGGQMHPLAFSRNIFFTIRSSPE